MSSNTPSIELDSDFNIYDLKAKIEASGVDRWVSLLSAAAYAGVTEATIRRVINDGFFTLTDGTRVPINVLKEEGKKPKISAKSLIDYVLSNRRKAGFVGTRKTTHKNLVVRFPRDRMNELCEYLKANGCEITDPNDLARKYRERREAAMRAAQANVESL